MINPSEPKAPPPKCPRIRITSETDPETRFIPLMQGKNRGKFNLGNLSGPGITGEVIYALKKHGTAFVTTDDGKQYTFTVEL